MAPDPMIGLAQALQALREQLTQAMNDGWNQGLGFQIEPVELTVQAVLDKDVNGKIGWGVLGIGGDYKSTTTQTLKLTLTPVWRRPDGSVTKDFTIADQQPVRPKIGRPPAPHPAAAEPVDPASPDES